MNEAFLTTVPHCKKLTDARDNGACIASMLATIARLAKDKRVCEKFIQFGKNLGQQKEV